MILFGIQPIPSIIPPGYSEIYPRISAEISSEGRRFSENFAENPSEMHPGITLKTSQRFYPEILSRSHRNMQRLIWKYSSRVSPAIPSEISRRIFHRFPN